MTHCTHLKLLIKKWNCKSTNDKCTSTFGIPNCHFVKKKCHQIRNFLKSTIYLVVMVEIQCKSITITKMNKGKMYYNKQETSSFLILRLYKKIGETISPSSSSLPLIKDKSGDSMEWFNSLLKMDIR